MGGSSSKAGPEAAVAAAPGSGTSPFPTASGRDAVETSDREALKKSEKDLPYDKDDLAAIVAQREKEQAAAREAQQKFGKLQSEYLKQYKLKEKNKPASLRGAASEEPPKNLVEEIYLEDMGMIDHSQAQRLPPMIVQELRNAAEKEAQRVCYESEKIMARCLQDKSWTAWKCQKDRDNYYMCLRAARESDILANMRWKYNLGVFYGEVTSRRTLMHMLWREYFPDREMAIPWADDGE